MSGYRLRLFDAMQHAFLQEKFSCRHDIDALDKAHFLSKGCAAELWRDDKLIARFKKNNAPLDETDSHSL